MVQKQREQRKATLGYKYKVTRKMVKPTNNTESLTIFKKRKKMKTELILSLFVFYVKDYRMYVGFAG